jgi:hypothetical protein
MLSVISGAIEVRCIEQTIVIFGLQFLDRLPETSALSATAGKRAR